jgi:hypothetical protein
LKTQQHRLLGRAIYVADSKYYVKTQAQPLHNLFTSAARSKIVPNKAAGERLAWFRASRTAKGFPEAADVSERFRIPDFWPKIRPRMVVPRPNVSVAILPSPK